MAFFAGLLKVRFLVVLFLMGLVMPVMAQGVTVDRFYIVPIEQVNQARGPEYFPWRFDANPEAIMAGVRWSCKDYGLVPQMICAAQVTQAQHDFLALQADVWAWPEDIETTLTAQERNDLGVFLEGADIPSDWLSPADTSRTALRTVTGLFLFSQRLNAITGSVLLSGGVTLNTQFQNTPVEVQAAIQQAADGLGYDRTWLTGNMTMRIMLKRFADEWGEQPIRFGFITL